jgi:CRP/FNR family cyclic AMP-dependent transcriptional regulator
MNATVNRMGAQLADHPFFSAMPVTALRRLAMHAYRHEYSAGQTLFAEGQTADRFFLIRTGLVRLDIEVPGRGRIDVEILGNDAALGWSWLFPPYQWHLGATALEHTKMIVFDAAVLRALMAADPVLGYELMRRFGAVLFDRLQVTRRRLTEDAGELPLASVSGPWAGKRARPPVMD